MKETQKKKRIILQRQRVILDTFSSAIDVNKTNSSLSAPAPAPPPPVPEPALSVDSTSVPSPCIFPDNNNIQDDDNCHNENESIKKRKKNENENENEDENTFTFIVGADTQLGISSNCETWDYELDYSVKAVNFINQLSPKPAFVCMCGDLIDMEPSIYATKYSLEKCLSIQSQQYQDFQRIWSQLDSSIPLLCLCGNHDVGNIPTAASIQRYTSIFGDDYYAFWYKQTYCICLNTNLYNNNSQAYDLYEQQHQWLENCLIHATQNKATQIFIFGHHPWFLLHENETSHDLNGINYVPNKGKEEFVPDSYFHIQYQWRHDVMRMCQEFHVTACFAGHYHQNLITYSSWGMPMIVTGAICNWNLQSTHKDLSIPEHQIVDAGVRIVTVDNKLPQGFHHQYCPI